jgi:urea ABC transporter permease protein UrtB
MRRSILGRRALEHIAPRDLACQGRGPRSGPPSCGRCAHLGDGLVQHGHDPVDLRARQDQRRRQDDGIAQVAAAPRAPDEDAALLAALDDFDPRIVIIFFAAFVVFLVWLFLSRTRLGLYVRAVTQNRGMADCMGIPTPRVDWLTFGLGSGIAGLGGVALSQIGNVGPDLGQSYIVDSFMVVVLGGVGQLAGTVYAALGLGIVNKLLEAWSGAVLAKIAVLVFIIVFIQKRPQGLFALKGRMAES